MPSDERKDQPWTEASGKAWSIVRSAMSDAARMTQEADTFKVFSAKLDALAAQCADRVLAIATPPAPDVEGISEQMEELHNCLSIYLTRDEGDRTMVFARFHALTESVRRALSTTPPAPDVTEAMVEALEAKKYPPPLASDQSIWNAAMNTAIEVVKSTAALRGGAK